VNVAQVILGLRTFTWIDTHGRLTADDVRMLQQEWGLHCVRVAPGVWPANFDDGHLKFWSIANPMLGLSEAAHRQILRAYAQQSLQYIEKVHSRILTRVGELLGYLTPQPAVHGSGFMILRTSLVGSHEKHVGDFGQTLSAHVGHEVVRSYVQTNVGRLKNTMSELSIEVHISLGGRKETLTF
jgi:hypothetical protein